MCEEGFSHSSNSLAARSAIVVRRAGLLENLLSSTRLAKVSSSLKDNRISIARKSCCLISAPFSHQHRFFAELWARQALRPDRAATGPAAMRFPSLVLSRNCLRHSNLRNGS
jgi:hypothetical protein